MSSMSSSSSSFAEAPALLPPTGPWWRHPMMWIVVGGPLLVVVASFVTLALAVDHADPVLRHGPDDNSAHASADDSQTATAPAALQPAMKARNHAATGGQEK